MDRYKEQAIMRQKFARANYNVAVWHVENNRPEAAKDCQEAAYRNSSLAMAYLHLLVRPIIID